MIALPLPAADVDDADAAFASAFAAALAGLHLQQGGAAADVDALKQAAQLACVAIREGHACADLDEDVDADGQHVDIAALRRSAMVGEGAQPTALVLAGSRLYLHRYWRYERELAAALLALNRPLQDLDVVQAAAVLERYFPQDAAHPLNWQKVAAATALSRHLCVISGGPGTGKTTTVVRVLAAMLSLQPSLRIAIAAPTGKAAARLKASIRNQVESLDLDEAVRARLPTQAHTLHRLLGNRPHRAGFIHNAGNPLPYQVVVVDEASMLDLALAAKLVAALPAGARLILLGDKDQLASVETGAVYTELSAQRAFDGEGRAMLAQLIGVDTLPADVGEQADGAMRNAVVWLSRAYRFAHDSGIAPLASAINDGNVPAVRAVFDRGQAGLNWRRELLPPPQLAAQLAHGFSGYVGAVLDRAPPQQVLQQFERYRVLCATRSGSYGSESLNRQISALLQKQLGVAGGARWYAGRAVMIAGNDYALKLFNGDIGIALADEQGRLLVHFAGDEGLRAFAPGRLSQLSNAYALTVHKSQGSEFDAVDVVVDGSLPRGLNRQLLYTAVTRARSSVRLWCADEALATMVAARSSRRSSILG